jgi:hypothetical protein
MRQRAEILTGIHLQITTHACRKMEAWMRYSPQIPIETDEGNIMELTTDEIIAKLMNHIHKLDGEMRFDESAVISQAVALIMSLRNAAERLRHPSNSDIVEAIRSQSQDELKHVIEWITEQR